MSKRLLLGFVVSCALGLGAYAQEQTIAPADNLVMDGIGKIPAAIAETAGRYGSYRGASFVDWSPTGREMLVATRFADTPQLHLVRMPGGARQQLTFFSDAVTAGRFHPNGGDYVVFMKDIGGGEWYQLYRYDLNTGEVTLLTDGKARNLMGPWSSGGDQIAYMSTRRTGKDTDLWVMNPGDPKTDRLLVKLEGGGWEPLDWSPDDKKILLLEELSINESHLWLVDTTTGEKTALTPRDAKEQVSYGEGQFSKDGKGIYVTTDKDSEFHRLAYLDLATKQHKYLTTKIPWDVERFDLSSDGRRIAFVSNEAGESKLYVMEAELGFGPTTHQAKIPSGVIGGVRWNKEGLEIGLSIVNAQTPGDVYSVLVPSMKFVQWTTSESAVRTNVFPGAKLVEWKSFDGKAISGFLYQPPAKFSGKRPVLVVIHGGPEGQSQPNFLGRSNYYLNELGIALIYPNVRGSTGYGKTFSLLDNGFLREDTYKDINALFDWIATQPDLDANRICVTGGSYGGHMTLAISTFYSDRIRCSVDIVGMSNLVTFLEHTEAYRRDLRRVEYGDERDPKMREFLEKIAPMNNIEKIKKPMMVVAGKNDPRVPVSESEQIVAALRKQATTVWYLMAKDEGHGFRKKQNQDFQFYATVEFLKEYLLK
ncbi:MAG TPA: prolyl oligopeptidase family serine peptidase [Candidatus Dormibacteraeota bacterium]|nr:prolyl oligopeptidase family serine peptidase [Candidatus Dormibacteraeota bacterium]